MRSSANPCRSAQIELQSPLSQRIASSSGRRLQLGRRLRLQSCRRRGERNCAWPTPSLCDFETGKGRLAGPWLPGASWAICAISLFGRKRLKCDSSYPRDRCGLRSLPAYVRLAGDAHLEECRHGAMMELVDLTIRSFLAQATTKRINTPPGSEKFRAKIFAIDLGIGRQLRWK